MEYEVFYDTARPTKQRLESQGKAALIEGKLQAATAGCGQSAQFDEPMSELGAIFNKITEYRISMGFIRGCK